MSRPKAPPLPGNWRTRSWQLPGWEYQPLDGAEAEQEAAGDDGGRAGCDDAAAACFGGDRWNTDLGGG